MRQSFRWCAACSIGALAAALAGGAEAAAQVRRPLPLAAVAPAHSADSAAAQDAAAQSQQEHHGQHHDGDHANDDGGRGGHAHGGGTQGGGTTTWLLWPAVFPYWTNGGYTPAFGPYAGGSPYFTQRGMNVLAPQFAQPPAQAVAPPAPSTPAPPKTRTTNAASKARAGKFLGYGDVNFGKQSYLSAAERYKTAAQAAPDVAEPYFRQGFAYVAMGKYESAARAFRRGLRVRADWSTSPFRLDQLYGADQIAKTSHVESLAKAVEANPLDAELLMVLGLEIFFDGQQPRSEVFFTRAAQLGGNEDHLLDDFLPRPGPAGAGRPAGAAAAPKPGAKKVF